MTRFIPVLLAVGLFSTSPALAQFGSPWIGFERSGTSLPSGATVSDDLHETDLDWGDVDLDGDVDLVVARKEPWTTTGGRSTTMRLQEARAQGGWRVRRNRRDRVRFARILDVPLRGAT